MNTEILMKPVCDNCGYVFHVLSYNTISNLFFPTFCPKCKKYITGLTQQDISTIIPDSDGNIAIIDEYIGPTM